MKIVAWYQTLIVTGFILLLLGLTYINKWIFLFGIGLFCIGIGYWKDGPRRSRILTYKSPNEPKPTWKEKVKEEIKDHSFFGALLKFFGFIFAIWSILQIFKHYFI